MAIKGTGLPLARTGEAVLQPTGSVGAISTAAEWQRIAQTGAQLFETGADAYQRDTQQAKLGYVAGEEVEIDRKKIELRDKYANDPEGFEREWTAYSEGKLGQAAPWAIPHLTKSLGSAGNQGYAATLSERRARDQKLDTDRVNALAATSANEVISQAMSGGLATEQGQAALLKYAGVLDSAVSAGLMPREEADMKLVALEHRAGAEVAVKAIRDTYKDSRARGLDAGAAALKAADEQILRNPDLTGLSEEQRYAYYHKATAEVRALEAERRGDLAEARQVKTNIEAALRNGVRVDDETIASVADQLQAAGGHADAAKLRASAARFDQLQAFGRLPLSQQVQAYGRAVTATGARFAGPIGDAINQVAAANGLDPVMLRRFVAIESGGNPNNITGSYKGLLQLSDAEFARHGGKGNILDPLENLQAGARKLSADIAAFRQRYGRDPSASDLYLVHQQGAGGYHHHVTNPAGLAWVNMAATAEGRQKGIAWAKRAIWGNVPDQHKKLFPGGVDSVTSADFVALWRSRVGDGGEPIKGGNPLPEGQATVAGAGTPATSIAVTPGVDYQLMSGQRREINSAASKAWANVEKAMTDGAAPDPAEIRNILTAATLAGDHALLDTVGERMARFEAAQEASQAPLAAQQGAVAELRARPSLTAFQARTLQDLEAVVKQTEERLRDDAVNLTVQRFPERFRPLQGFNLADRNATMDALRERARIATFASQNFEVAGLSVLTQADVTQVQNAIASSDSRAAGAALDMLASVPDEFFTATLKNPKIVEAINGATRSTDPATYTAAMTALDKMWSRAPAEVDKLLGGDAVKALQDWQGKLRYASAQDLTDHLRRRDDPLVIQRRQTLIKKGFEVAATKSPDQLLSDLDPGIFQRQPGMPIDTRIRDAAMGDYSRLFAERYAETLDESVAHRQAIERMKLAWGKSEVNGGRLTLRPPEQYYPAVNGSHAWMGEQLRSEVMGRLKRLPDQIDVVTDRQTEADIASGRPPSYLVVFRDKADAPADILRSPNGAPARFYWDASEVKANARDEFERQRQRFLERRNDASPGSLFTAPILEVNGWKSPSLSDLGFNEAEARASRERDPVRRLGRELSRRLNEGGSLVRRGNE